MQHWVVLGQDRDDYAGIFRPLTLMDGGGVGGNQRVKLAEAVGDLASGNKLTDLPDVPTS